MPEQNGVTTPATGAAPEAAVPKGLEKFAGPEGKLDVAKLGEGYINLEKMSTQNSQKLAEVERTLAMLSAGSGGSGTFDAGAGADSGRAGVADDTEPVTRAEARSVVQSIIELAHPEIAYDPATRTYKDPAFVDGLKGYIGGLPVPLKQSIAAGDFAMTDWAIKQYKTYTALKADGTPGVGASGSGSPVKPNFAEGATGGGQVGGKTYTRSELQKLMIDNPAEYARIADSEVGKAYEEGRVK